MRIGILGGTFDPIHRGHTYVARKVLKTFRLDQILFMISHLPPHKGRGETTSAYHRHAMVVLELLEEDRLFASQWELQRSSFSYTIDTLRNLSRYYPEHRHCFIAGSDALQEIHLWKEYDKLLSEHSFIFVQRPGAEVDVHGLKIPASLRKTVSVVRKGDQPTIEAGRSFLISLNAPPISSTSIRQMIAAGKRLSTRFLSPAVFQYIQKYRLYEEDEDHS